jgi:hypothetical protein
MKNLIAYSASGIPTLKWEIIKEQDSYYVEYEIIAPFISRGEVRRFTWCWAIDYPMDKMYKEADVHASYLASQMWGEV